MSAKPRKASGSFVNEISSVNLIQLSPRNELYQTERGPYTITSHNSKTNFIGDTVLSDGPRAVSVSQTGEKHRLPLEEETVLTATTNPFSAVPSQCSQLLEPTATLNNILSSANLNTESNNQQAQRLITTKRTKGCRRHGNQKSRPIFTPRGLTPRFYTAPPKPKNQLQNAQTQTEIKSSNIAIPSLATRHHYHMPPPPTQLPTLQVSRRYLPARECGGSVLDSNTRLQSLRVLGHDKRPMNSITELRNIASAVTLITVVSWLFSLFFELESIVDIFTSPLHLLQSWYAKKEQPMTKMEMFVQYMRDLWS